MSTFRRQFFFVAALDGPLSAQQKRQLTRRVRRTPNEFTRLPCVLDGITWPTPQLVATSVDPDDWVFRFKFSQQTLQFSCSIQHLWQRCSAPNLGLCRKDLHEQR